MLKSIAAIVLGFLTVVVLSTATDAVFEATGIFPPIGNGLFVPWMLALALAYRTAYTVLAGYIAAWLSPNGYAHRNVMILGILGTIGGIIGIFVGWDLSDHWYPIALAVLAYPSVWFGGRLRLNS